MVPQSKGDRRGVKLSAKDMNLVLIFVLREYGSLHKYKEV